MSILYHQLKERKKESHLLLSFLFLFHFCVKMCRDKKIKGTMPNDDTYGIQQLNPKNLNEIYVIYSKLK